MMFMDDLLFEMELARHTAELIPLLDRSNQRTAPLKAEAGICFFASFQIDSVLFFADLESHVSGSLGFLCVLVDP